MYSDALQQFFEGRHYRVFFEVDFYNQCGNTRYFSTRKLAEDFVAFLSNFGINCSIFEHKVFD